MSTPAAPTPAAPSLTLAVVHLRTVRERAPGFQRELDALNASAVATIEALGHTALLLPAAELPAGETLRRCAEADAVLLMGGEDVDPRCYGGARDYPGSGTTEPFADAVQLAVIRAALATGTPLLGICRGLQLINVALGGTLIEHLDTTAAHRADGADPFQRTRLSFLDARLGADVDPAAWHRCTHHQAVRRLGTGLLVAARTADGVVEAVLHASAPIAGVQWHPEHPQTASSQLHALVQRLLRQVAAGTLATPGTPATSLAPLGSPHDTLVPAAVPAG